ncbi:transposase [Leptospira mtsangambouensis]|uniref:transposase n=1 Tax=Leptospira mtsangambouensis TaxID=2484912 RepID=UPI001EEB6564|nr:transposase [Leptospira mtsangambouensis]MCG6140666.1 transposase [Leptospira mtsangambouensis]
MTSKEIARKLSIPYKTAFYLKKRIQVIFSHLNESLREKLYKELENPEYAKDKIAVADSVVLYSSSLRANKFRSRRYKGGSASIYLSNSIGGEQKGTLVHTVGINGGMTFYKSIPLSNQYYLEKDLEEKIPKNVTLYTDQGYEFIWDRPNHKSVNHSRKSNDPRYNMSRERWVTKEGVSSNGAEARNNILKQSFRSYGYISPKWSQLYLTEISLLGNIRFVPELRNLLGFGESRFVGLRDFYYSQENLTHKTENYNYLPLSLEARNKLKTRKLVNHYREQDIAKYNKDYRTAILHNDHYWEKFYQKDRMKNEVEYNSKAFKIYSITEKRKWIDVDSIANQLKLNKREVIFIIKKWRKHGIADIIERQERYRKIYKFKVKNVKLYYLVYSNFTEVK